MKPKVFVTTVLCLVVVGLACPFGAGCAGYSTNPLHRTDVETVAVPVFHSREFRRQLEFALTEELIKAIQNKTPYRIVQDRSRADTEIRGEIIELKAPVLSEDVDTDSALEVQVTLTARFEWKDLRSGKVLASREVSDVGIYTVALGQTQDSATTQAVRRVARRIVEAMEEPW